MFALLVEIGEDTVPIERQQVNDVRGRRNRFWLTKSEMVAANAPERFTGSVRRFFTSVTCSVCKYQYVPEHHWGRRWGSSTKVIPVDYLIICIPIYPI